MATLEFQQVRISGALKSTSAAGASGDKVRPNDRGFVEVVNGSAGAVTVTVVVPGTTKYGQPQPDAAVVVAAGATALIGPFPGDLADPADGLVALTYSATASVTVAAIQV